MKIAVMTLEDVKSVIPLYINYYNTHEGSCWTEETTQCRITQVITMNGSYSLIMRDDEDNAVGFVMGYFKQYDDIVGYTLEEIIMPLTPWATHVLQFFRIDHPVLLQAVR